MNIAIKKNRLGYCCVLCFQVFEIETIKKLISVQYVIISYVGNITVYNNICNLE